MPLLSPSFEDTVIGDAIIGHGSFGVVLRASCAGTACACKRIDITNKAAAADGFREAAVLSRLEASPHAHVVRLVAWSSNEMHLHLVLELCAGPDLEQILMSRGALAEVEAQLVGSQQLSALRFLHEEHGVLHLDVKPGNIMCAAPLGDLRDSALDGVQTKLVDFGFAVWLPPSDDDASESLVDVPRVGTRGYAAPELTSAGGAGANGPAAIDPSLGFVRIPRRAALALDLYALGKVCRHLLTGVEPSKRVMDALLEQSACRECAQSCLRALCPSWAGPRPPLIREMSELSPPSREIVQLLTRDPPRASAAEASAHPWMTAAATAATGLPLAPVPMVEVRVDCGGSRPSPLPESGTGPEDGPRADCAAGAARASRRNHGDCVGATELQPLVRGGAGRSSSGVRAAVKLE